MSQRTYWTNFFFLILFASQCVTHIWVATERLRLFTDHHYQRQKNVALVKWGPGSLKSQAEPPKESPWMWPAKPRKRGQTMKAFLCGCIAPSCRGLPVRTQTSQGPLSQQFCLVQPVCFWTNFTRLDKINVFLLKSLWAGEDVLQSFHLKWRIYSFLPVV